MFIPREPVIENIFCKFAAQQNTTAGTGATLAEAGAVVYHLTKTADSVNGSDTELVVRPLATTNSGVGTSTPAVGFLEQAVKTDYHDVHPAGYVLQRDLAGSWAVAMPSFDANGNVNGTKATAVAIANLGIWETTFYTSVDNGSYTAVTPMQPMYVTSNDGGKITNQSTSMNGGNPVAYAMSGVSAAQAEKNATGAGKFPIKVKLVI